MAAWSAFVLVALVLAVAGCGTQQRAPDDVISGHYVWGAEVNVLNPCGSDQEYWVTGTPEIVRALRDRYTALGLGPYEEAFVVVRGEVGPVLDCGFCAEYDGSFRVTELLVMEPTGPADCLGASGNP